MDFVFLMEPESEEQKIAKFHAFVKKLKKDSLEPLLKELESPETAMEYEVYYDRTEPQWQKLYGPFAVDVYNHLHKKGI